MKSTSRDSAQRPLPLHVKAGSAINQGGRFTGHVATSQLPRLAALLAGPDGELVAELAIERDERRRPHLRGHVDGRLPLTCQRCLRPFDWALAIGVDLQLVDNETAETAALKDGEALLLENDLLPLREVVEDEALLALPIAPRCGRPDCAGP